MAFDFSLAIALGAGLEEEGVGVQLVVRGDRAILATAARVLHHHRDGKRDAAQVFWHTETETLSLYCTYDPYAILIQINKEQHYNTHCISTPAQCHSVLNYVILGVRIWLLQNKPLGPS